MGVQIIQYVQGFQSELLDVFFVWITRLGVEEFYLVFLPVVYWVVSRDVGIRLTLVFLASALTNGFLKDLFMMSRPSAAEGVRILYEESGTGWGFPSGHAQDATALWGYVAARYGSRQRFWFWLAPLIIVLVSLSRVYLGLHYPTDVVGGIVFGLIIIVAALRLEAFGQRYRIALPAQTLLALSPLLALTVYHTDFAYKLIGLMVGTIVGYVIDINYVHFSARSTIGGHVVKVLVGGGIFIALRVLTGMLVPDGPLQLARHIVLGVWATGAAPAVFRKIGVVKD